MEVADDCAEVFGCSIGGETTGNDGGGQGRRGADAQERVFPRLTWLYIQTTKKHSVASSTDSVSALTEALNSHHAARAALIVLALLLPTDVSIRRSISAASCGLAVAMGWSA